MAGSVVLPAVLREVIVADVVGGRHALAGMVAGEVVVGPADRGRVVEGVVPRAVVEATDAREGDPTFESFELEPGPASVVS